VTGNLSRRRFIRLTASLASIGAAGAISTRSLAASEPAPLVWRGLVLGNLASIEIRHADPARAARLLELAQGEVARLESVMSLYRPDSALSMLNAEGALRDPPLDLVQVLAEARRFGEITSGAFDVTVQPLWKVYADHFAATGADPAGPSSDAIRRAAEHVDYRALEIEPSLVGLRQPGMALTLNGIAQGYITDRIAELLRNEGLDNVLVDLGEIRAVGTRDRAQQWRAGIENSRRTGLVAEVPLTDQALSTSGSYGFRFDPTGRFHHIFDPRSGACPQLYASVSVVAARSVVADALATACNLTPLAAIPDLLRAAGASRAFVLTLDGGSQWLEA
jgi:thiamine biosynthesis lipoprotein